jgi:hypothetical protein
MAEMGKYCKAYYVERFRAYKGWKEDVSDLRTVTKEVDGKDVEIEKTSLAERDILYLHDNYVVTDGIFKDENVVFDAVDDAWKEFCTKELEFQIPVYETATRD